MKLKYILPVTLILLVLIGLAWSQSEVTASRTEVPTKSTFRIYTCTDPAAGSEWTCTVPAGRSWRLLAVNAQLVTDATVANRVASILLDDGSNVFMRSTGNVNQTASTTANYLSGQDMGVSAGALGAGNAVYSPMTYNVTLGPGYRIRSSTAAIVAGDNWGQPVIAVEEFAHINP